MTLAKLRIRLIVESPGAADLVVAESEEADIWVQVLGEIMRRDRERAESNATATTEPTP